MQLQMQPQLLDDGQRIFDLIAVERAQAAATGSRALVGGTGG